MGERTSKKQLVVLSGAGMSAESGIATFRGADGLWEGHRVEEVASLRGIAANPELVMDFYNQRRRQVVGRQRPTRGTWLWPGWNPIFDVKIVTQNVDDLHERAGSTQVMHLHGEIRKARSTSNPELVLDVLGTELNMGDLGPDGAQLRPHIVWFGEAVPMIDPGHGMGQVGGRGRGGGHLAPGVSGCRFGGVRAARRTHSCGGPQHAAGRGRQG